MLHGRNSVDLLGRNPTSHTSCIFELCYVVLLHVQYAWIFPILWGLFETSRPGCQHILGSTSVRIWNDSYQLFISWNTLIMCSKHISKFEGTSFDSRAGFQFSSPTVCGGKWSMQVAHMLNYSDLHPTCQSCPIGNKGFYYVKQILFTGMLQPKIKSQSLSTKKKHKTKCGSIRLIQISRCPDIQNWFQKLFTCLFKSILNVGTSRDLD